MRHGAVATAGLMEPPTAKRGEGDGAGSLGPEDVGHRPAHVVPLALERPAVLQVDGGGVVDASADQGGQAQAGANPRVQYA